MGKPRHKLTKHHRKPSSLSGTNEDRNISMLPEYIHSAWHAIVSNHSAPTICFILNEKFLDPDYKFICVTENQYEKAVKAISQLT